MKMVPPREPIRTIHLFCPYFFTVHPCPNALHLSLEMWTTTDAQDDLFRDDNEGSIISSLISQLRCALDFSPPTEPLSADPSFHGWIVPGSEWISQK